MGKRTKKTPTDPAPGVKTEEKTEEQFGLVRMGYSPPPTLAKAKKEERQELFLKGFLMYGTITAGCESAGVSYSAFYKWAHDEDDDAFAIAFATAKMILADELEEVALKRAKAGSDYLLGICLKAAKPEKYRDNVKKVLGDEEGERSTPDGFKPLSKMTVDELDAEIKALEAELNGTV